MVSVIIPIYNVCKFIEHGLQQVLQQTYEDFEVIMVDDGSTDDSLEKCQKFASQDPRIRVLHQQNKGAGGARNLGIEKAKGDYIYFFDIDDEIKPNLLEYCVSKMDELHVDMLVFGYKNCETLFKHEVIVDFPETKIFTNKDLRNIFVNEFVMKVNGFPWNKFYRKSFLDKYGLRYENQRIQQDEVFNLMCYRYLECVYLSPEILYTYYIYEKGNTRSRFIPDRFDIYKSVRKHFDELVAFWDLKDSRMDDYLNNRFYLSVMQCMLFNINHPDCQWTKSEKQYELTRIMQNSLTIAAFNYADSHIIQKGSRLCRKACIEKSLWKLQLYTRILGAVHKLHKMLK